MHYISHAIPHSPLHPQTRTSTHTHSHTHTHTHTHTLTFTHILHSHTFYTHTHTQKHTHTHNKHICKTEKTMRTHHLECRSQSNTYDVTDKMTRPHARSLVGIRDYRWLTLTETFSNIAAFSGRQSCHWSSPGFSAAHSCQLSLISAVSMVDCKQCPGVGDVRSAGSVGGGGGGSAEDVGAFQEILSTVAFVTGVGVVYNPRVRLEAAKQYDAGSRTKACCCSIFCCRAYNYYYPWH